MITRLLARNISVGQIVGYAAANLIGLAIVLGAIQLFRDVTSVSSDSDSFVSSDYLIIAKHVSGLGGTKPFTKAEIEEISRQPWTADVGEFTAANFNVAASVALGAGNMSTSLFLESIPDRFFDITPEGWDSYTSGGTVPVVISKDYLTLYNFGYAGARGLPQLSEELISQVPLKLYLSGNGRQEWVDARIAGFSSRLNTIAVPERFMKQANDEFAGGQSQPPSRLIVKLKRAADPDAMAFMKAHGYEPAGDREAAGKAYYFLGLVTTVVASVGGLICLLALFILVLSVYLLLQKNRDKIHDLLLLGYTPRSVSAVYIRMIAVVNLCVLVLAVGAVAWGAHAWADTLSRIDAGSSPLWPTVATGVAITLLITLAGAWAVSRKVKGAFR